MRHLRTLAAALLLLLGVGCANHPASAPIPVPGQLNTFDAYAFRVLYDAQAALSAFSEDVQSGKVPAATVKVPLNQAITDYDAAETTYKVWRAAGGSTATSATAPVTAALTKVQSDITAIAGGAK